MKITHAVIRMLEVPLPAPGFRPAWSSLERVIGTTMVELHTDVGLVGVGGTESQQGRAMAETIVSTIVPQLVGRDPLETEACIDVVRRATRFGAAPWWVEMALWDLVGKLAGLPLWRMWGGGTPRLLAYASTGELRSAEARAQDCVRLREAGFQAFKLRLHHESLREDVAVVEAARHAVGPDVALMVDANQGLPTTRAGLRTARWRRARRWHRWASPGSRSRWDATSTVSWAHCGRVLPSLLLGERRIRTSKSSSLCSSTELSTLCSRT